MARFIQSLLAAAIFILPACGSGSETLLFVDAVDYTAMEPAGGCPTDPENAIYHSCIDNEALFTAAVDSAKAEGNPLMVIWGFNECPYCKVFDGENFNPKAPWKTADFIKKLTPAQRADMSKDEQENFQISLVRLHSRTPNGLAFADKIGVTDLAKARGWHRVWSPFIMVVDPATGNMHTEEKWNAQWSFCESASEFIVNLTAIGALPDDKDHAWPMCPST
jgi:thioredoxin-related protein